MIQWCNWKWASLFVNSESVLIVSLNNGKWVYMIIYILLFLWFRTTTSLVKQALSMNSTFEKKSGCSACRSETQLRIVSEDRSPEVSRTVRSENGRDGIRPPARPVTRCHGLYPWPCTSWRILPKHFFFQSWDVTSSSCTGIRSVYHQGSSVLVDRLKGWTMRMTSFGISFSVDSCSCPWTASCLTANKMHVC